MITASVLKKLNSRKQGWKKGSTYSSWNIVRGVPHRCILGPLLFNVVINDILTFIEKVTSVTKNNTLYDSRLDLSNILINLMHNLKNILETWTNFNSWFLSLEQEI